MESKKIYVERETFEMNEQTNREGKRTIPIRMESEGIIKIVSILNVLIQAFGNSSICLVIDELDAGIFFAHQTYQKELTSKNYKETHLEVLRQWIGQKCFDFIRGNEEIEKLFSL